jgi:hypothetical protein
VNAIQTAAFEEGRALGKDHAEALDYAAAVARNAVCRYSARHQAEGVQATEILDCGPVGKVHACTTCAEFYGRMS